MSEGKSCSRDDCPVGHTHKDYTTKCGKCGNVLHLMCIGINRKTAEVIFHPNIRLFCNKCAKNGAEKSSKVSSKQMIETSTAYSSPQSTNSSATNVLSTAKMDSMIKLLNQVHNVVTDTNAKLVAHVASSQTYADTLKQVKELSANTNEKLVEAKKNSKSFSSVVSSKPKEFPPLNAQTPKRRRENDTPVKKFPDRKLIAGTGADQSHGLGGTVVSSKPKRARASPSPYERLNKFIYVSRLQTDVTAEKVTEYIRSKMPEMNDADISLRLLVKKDTNLSELTFVSFRLACTEAHYEQLMDPSFWPAHVMIGEFLENDRRPPKAVALIKTPVVDLTNDSSGPKSTMPSEKTNDIPKEVRSNPNIIENARTSSKVVTTPKTPLTGKTVHRTNPNGKDDTAMIVE